MDRGSPPAVSIRCERRRRPRPLRGREDRVRHRTHGDHAGGAPAEHGQRDPPRRAAAPTAKSRPAAGPDAVDGRMSSKTRCLQSSVLFQFVEIAEALAEARKANLIQSVTAVRRPPARARSSFRKGRNSTADLGWPCMTCSSDSESTPGPEWRIRSFSAVAPQRRAPSTKAGYSTSGSQTTSLLLMRLESLRSPRPNRFVMHTMAL